MAVVFQSEIRHVHQIDQIKVHSRNISKKYRDVIGDIIEQGQEEGCMRKDLYIGLVKYYILGAVEEVINTWIHSRSDYDLVSMADPLVELYMNGIGSKTVPIQT